MDMVEQSNEYTNRYKSILDNIRCMIVDDANEELYESYREDFGKLGLFASAGGFLKTMYYIRKGKDDMNVLKPLIYQMAVEALLAISWYTENTLSDIVDSQLALFKIKNKRYGNSFAECFSKDGFPYAFGHLQEKINRICSLLILNDEAKEEPVIDSYKDLLGYCVLTLIEIEKLKEN